MSENFNTRNIYFNDSIRLQYAIISWLNLSISEYELLQVRFRFFFVDTCINICIRQPQLTWLRTHTHTYIEDEALEHKVKTDQFIDEYCYYRSNGRHYVLHGCDCMLICRTSSSSTRQLQTL